MTMTHQKNVDTPIRTSIFSSNNGPRRPDVCEDVRRAAAGRSRRYHGPVGPAERERVVVLVHLDLLAVAEVAAAVLAHY